MVKLNQKQINNQNGLVMPIMFVHNLKSEKHFNGNTISCYVTEMDNGRYGVFSSLGNSNTFYKVMENVNELHESFEEMP